jgi:dolichyl-phosphate beta-glucosyltransferase
MAIPALSIVIPCYNEANRLPRTLERSIDYLRLRERESEIIVVSDGSKDATKDVAESRFAALPTNITARVIEYTPNQGKGYAVKVGMLAARGERVLFMDADYAVPMTYLDRAEEILDRGIDIAIGSRALEETKIVEAQSFLRERLAKLFGLLQRSYLGLKQKDTQCGFKLFSREAVDKIFPRVKLNSVIFDGEVLWLARKAGLQAEEFPVEWTHDQDTRISYTPIKALMVLLDFIKIPLLHLSENKN